MKECIEEWWRIGRKIQPQMRNTQISPSFLTWFPRDPKVLQALQASKKCPRSAPSRVFPASPQNIQLSLFICWEIGQNAQLRSALASCSPVGEPLARFQRRHATRVPVDLKFAFPCSFFSFVVALGFHRASNTCPPLPTQARKRVEEFLCLTYTIIKLQISHKWMISYLHHFLLVFVCFVVYVSSKRVWTRRK